MACLRLVLCRNSFGGQTSHFRFRSQSSLSAVLKSKEQPARTDHHRSIPAQRPAGASLRQTIRQVCRCSAPTGIRFGKEFKSGVRISADPQGG